MRFRLTRILFFAPLLAALTLLFIRPRIQGPRPNIVLIVIDTLRADHLPFYGYPRATAPFLTELVANGIVFQNAFSASSWTAPAAASIFTSLYPFQHKVLNGKNFTQDLSKKYPDIRLNRIPSSLDTVTEILRRHGYRTFGISDNLNICPEEGFTQGFQKFIQIPDEGADAINRIVKRWYEKITRGGPYFLYLHYNDPHYPYQKHLPWYQPGEGGAADEDARAYDSEIGYVDSRIRELFHIFRWDRNTLIIVTADHGEEIYDHGHLGHGKTLYNEVLHVPLVMYFPGQFPAPKVVEGTVSTMDILPTVRAIIHAPAASRDIGINLLPLIDGQQGQDRPRYVLGYLWCYERECFLPEDGEVQSITDGSMKYLSVPGDEMLFDLRRDPGEKTNLIGQDRATAVRLRTRLHAMRSSFKEYKPEFSTIVPDESIINELRTLGYLQ